MAKKRAERAGVEQLTARVGHDPDTESPMEDDGSWTLYSFSRRHCSYRDPESLGLGELGADGLPVVGDPELRAKLAEGLAFFVSYYEHGRCAWFLPGDGPSCPWDGVRVAGLLVWEHDAADMGAKDRAGRRADAAVFLREFTYWCNGDTYWFAVEDADGNVVDSCGGFIGTDYMLDVIREVADGRPVKFVGEFDWLQADYDARAKAAGARP